MSIWDNPEALKMVKALAAEGHTGRQIAIVLSEALGVRVTRNMVGGQCDRHGIKLMGKRHVAPTKPGGPKRVRKRATAPAVSASPAAAAHGGCGRLTFARRAIAAKQGLPTAVPFRDPMRKDDAADRPTGLLDLKRDTCRWPFGDPGRPGFHFCGGRALDGRPYCARHEARATTPRLPAQFREARGVTGRWSDTQWTMARRLAKEGADAGQIGEVLRRSAAAVIAKFDKHGVRAPRQPRPPSARKRANSAGQVHDRVSAEALAEREARLAALARRSLTQAFCNDPPPGWSALDRRS